MVRGAIGIILLIGNFGLSRAQKPSVGQVTLKVVDIEIAGNESLSSEFILEVMGLKVGDLISTTRLDLGKGIKNLWKQQVVNDISVSLAKTEGSEAWLLIEIEELPRLAKFEIQGLKKAYSKDLESSMGLLRGRILTPATLKNAEQTIRNYLQRKGYGEAQIQAIQGHVEGLNNSVNLTFRVDPGPKLKVALIEFQGNQFLSDRDLNQVLASRQSLIGKPQFDRERMVRDRENLLLAYRNQGFMDAVLLKDSVVKLKQNRIKIVYQIEEGNRYYFGNINWKGNKLFESGQLSRFLAITEGDVYNPELLNRRLYFDPASPDISSIYMDRGYMFLDINPVQTRTRTDTIDLEIRIKEGKQATIGNVTIKGNEITSDHVIRREIRTLPGNPFNRTDMIRSQRDLAQLGFFDPAQLNVTPSANAETGVVDLEYSVVEKPNDQYELSGGWGGSYGFIGSAGIVFNNFSSRGLFDSKKWRPYPAGDGQKLGLKFQSNANSFQNYSLSFSEPWFRGKPNTLSFSLTHSAQKQENILSDGSQDDQISTGSLKLTGGTVSLTRRLTWPDDYFTLTHGINYYHYGFDNYQSSLGLRTGSSNNLNFFTTLARSNIDNPIFPRTGSLFSLSLQFTPPHSIWSDSVPETSTHSYTWLEYYKWMLDYRKYKTLVGNLVLEGRVHMGLLGAYNGAKGVGPFERFYLGGSGLGGQDIVLGNDVIGLRGYPDNSLVPIDQNGIEGGVLYNKFSLELRYPIVEKPWGTIYVLGFAEAGNNWADFGDYNPFDLRKSVGVGLRFILPGLGDIGLDWGNGLDPVPGALEPSGSQFHITIGKQLR